MKLRIIALWQKLRLLFTPKPYNSLDDIPVFNFFEIMEKGNYKWLFSKPKKDILNPSKELYNAWNNLYDDYVEKTQTAETTNYFQLSKLVAELETRYMIISALIHSLDEQNKETIGRELNAWGVIFNIKGKVSAQKENLERFLRASSNKMKRKRSELTTITENDKKKAFNLYKDKITLESATGVKIDVYKMVMSEYIAVHELGVEMIEQRKKAANGGKSS